MRSVLIATVVAIGVGHGAAATEPPPDTPTLRLAVTPGWESSVEPMISSVGDGSDRSLKIDLDFEWQDAHLGPDIEREIVEAVAAGDVDLGFIGTRAFGELGLHNFDALTAPLLVDSYPLQQAVLDSDIPDRMLATLDEVGVTGLAMAAGQLRRPMGVNGPLLGPDDYAGITFHTWRSATNAATAAALGATHSDVFGSERDDGLVNGTIDGTENTLSWMLANGRAPYATLNAVLWPATAVLIANPNTLAALSDAQADTLRDAATGSMASPAELAEADGELVADVCSLGHRLAEASAEEIAALRDAVAPVYAQLQEDPNTAAFIAEIEALKVGVLTEPLAIPDGCTGSIAVGDAEASEQGDDPSVLNGSYQLEWTAEELIDASGGNITERDARNNAGVFVLTFEDGTFNQVWANDPTSRCPGTYTVSGNRVTMVSSSDIAEWDCGGDSLGRVVVDAAWALTDDQLILSDFTLADQPDVTWWNAVFLSKPLTRLT